jgi:acyl dehydratase
MIAGYYEDLEIGQRFVSRGRTITETDVLGFAGLSGDFHPLHTDAVYAAEGPFGSRIAHGLLTLAITTGLMAPPSPEAIKAFYGLDRVRFLRPVYLGDTIHFESEVAEVREPEKGRSVVTLAVTVINQKAEPVLAMQMKFVVALREAQALDAS